VPNSRFETSSPTLHLLFINRLIGYTWRWFYTKAGQSI
jgi:hypothetical protein